MFPNLKNRKFTDISTNESFKVIDQFENIAILDNKQRIDVKRLLDSSYYDENIDPKDFLSQQSLVSLAEKIKSIPTEALNSMKDDDGPALMEYDPEEEKRLLTEKARQMSNPSNEVQKQLEKFKGLLDEDDEIVQNIPDKSQQNIPDQNQSDFYNEPYTQEGYLKSQLTNTYTSPIPEVTQDPMISMFKNIKKNTDFKITLDIENKIPRPDFIEMMEDSYEISIIDYLSEEFTNKILENPSIIKDKIKEEITKIVYKTKKEPKINTVITEEKPQDPPKRKRTTVKKEQVK